MKGFIPGKGFFLVIANKVIDFGARANEQDGASALRIWLSLGGRTGELNWNCSF
jgi:hypothetical protein